MSYYPPSFNTLAYLDAYGPELAPNPHDGGYCNPIDRRILPSTAKDALAALPSDRAAPWRAKAIDGLEAALGRHDTASLLDLIEAASTLIVIRDEGVPGDMERAGDAYAGIEDFLAVMRGHPMVEAA